MRQGLQTGTQIQSGSSNSFIPIRPRLIPIIQSIPKVICNQASGSFSSAGGLKLPIAPPRPPVRIAPKPTTITKIALLPPKTFTDLSDSDRDDYLASRKRRRKQDLSSLVGKKPDIQLVNEANESTEIEEITLDEDEEATTSDSSFAKTPSLVISTSSLFKSRHQSKKSSASSSDNENFFTNNSIRDNYDDDDDECDDNEIRIGAESMSCDSDDSDDTNEGSRRSNNRKRLPPNIHSLRERERRFRLKKLLLNLQLTFLDVDCTNLNDAELSQTAGKACKLLKTRSSKQAILHEVINRIFDGQFLLTGFNIGVYPRRSIRSELRKGMD